MDAETKPASELELELEWRWRELCNFYRHSTCAFGQFRGKWPPQRGEWGGGGGNLLFRVGLAVYVYVWATRLYDFCLIAAANKQAPLVTHIEREKERDGEGGRGVLAWNGFGVQVENWIYHLNMPNERQIALWFSFSLPLLIQWKFFVGKSHWDTCNQLVCAAFCNPQSAAPTLAALATSYLPLATCFATVSTHSLLPLARILV